MTQETSKKSKIQKVYYTERAKSSIAEEEPFFKFGEIVWGTGFVRIENDEIFYDDIPDNVSSIEGEVFRSSVVKNFINDKILLSATFPKSQMPETSKKITTLYQLDTKGNILIVFLYAPMWTSSTRDINLDAQVAIGDL